MNTEIQKRKEIPRAPRLMGFLPSPQYIIYIIDIRRHGRWAGKAVLSFYLNLASDLFQLFVYMVFFAIVFSYYGLPLHIVRDLYNTFGRFKKRIADFVR